MPWNENEKRTIYSKSKYLSEQEVWEFMHNGLNAVIVNPGVILGYSPSDAGSSKLFLQSKKGLPFYTNGGSGYVDVEDVAKIMILLMNSEITNERFIITGENCSNREILNWMVEGFNKSKPYICIGKIFFHALGLISEIAAKIFMFQPMFDRNLARTATNRSYYSNRKISKALNYTFNPIEKCVKKVCKHMLEQN